jgi:DNA-binding transcriptional LysR family regulator
MSINKYEIFEEIIKTGSFTKASESLHVTQSAVSHAVASLEKELGITLFIREARSIHLTPKGAKAYEYIQEILTLNRKLINTDFSDSDKLPRILKIGSLSSVNQHVLPSIIELFHNQYPFVKVIVLEGTYIEIEEWMREGVIDIGFTLSNTEEFNATLFMEDELLIATSSKAKETVHKESLRDFFQANKIIMPTAPYQKQIELFFTVHTITPAVHSYISDCNTIVKMVSLGMGITIGPKLFLQLFDDLVLHSLPEKHYRNIYLIHQHDSEQHKYIQRFIELAEEER